MSDNNDNKETPNLNRVLGGTEYSWCKAVPGGTGITVLALLLSKNPGVENLQNALGNLQIHRPILNASVHPNPALKSFSFVSDPNPNIEIQSFDARSTAEILRSDPGPDDLHRLIEHEMNRNDWVGSDFGTGSARVFFASLYELAPPSKWVLALRLHTAACDRTAAAALLRALVKELESPGSTVEIEGEGSLGIENLVPKGKGNKVFWARGVDMLGYSLNAFRLTNLEFKGASWPRSSRFVRLRMGIDQTTKLIEGCKLREIKLSAALAAAALISARSVKNIPKQQKEKYGVVTLTDCRSILEPPLSNQHLGFYHSAILNTHDVTGNESLWDLAKRTHSSFANAKDNNKHFSDMADLNFLMLRAIENPGLTPSSSLRTAFVSVFEDPVIDLKDPSHVGLGLEDYIGCSSVHGVGPSIGIFDTIRDGELDSALVYPFPLHSRDQMEEIVEGMKMVFVECCTNVENSIGS